MANYYDSSSNSADVVSLSTQPQCEGQAVDYQSFVSAGSALEQGQWKLYDPPAFQRTDGSSSQSYNPVVHFYISGPEGINQPNIATCIIGAGGKVERELFDKVVAERDEAIRERDIAIQARDAAEQNLSKMRKRLTETYDNLRGIQNLMDDVEGELYPELPCPSRYMHFYEL